MNQKLLSKVTLVFLTVFFLGLGFTSIFHEITFWKISNENVYAYILSIGNLLGIIASIILAFFPPIYKLNVIRWAIFGLTFFIELLGNVFYHYVNIDLTDPLFLDFVSLTKPFFDQFNTFEDYPAFMRSLTAVTVGIWIPFTHVFVFNAITRIVETPYLEQKSLEPQVDDNKVEPAKNVEEQEVVETQDVIQNEVIDGVLDKEPVIVEEEPIVDVQSLVEDNFVETTNDEVPVVLEQKQIEEKPLAQEVKRRMVEQKKDDTNKGKQVIQSWRKGYKGSSGTEKI
jgi:hypothetical protein